MKWEYYILLTGANCGKGVGGVEDLKSLHFPCPQPPVKPTPVMLFFFFNHLIPSFLFSHLLPFF